MLDALAEARTVAAGVVGTQNQIDAPERALSYELARLGTLKAPAPSLDVELTAGTRCVAGKAGRHGAGDQREDVPISVAFETPYGTKSFASVAPGKNAVHAFTTRLASVPEGAASAEFSATIDGEPVSPESEVAVRGSRLQLIWTARTPDDPGPCRSEPGPEAASGPGLCRASSGLILQSRSPGRGTKPRRDLPITKGHRVVLTRCPF